MIVLAAALAGATPADLPPTTAPQSIVLPAADDATEEAAPDLAAPDQPTGEIVVNGTPKAKNDPLAPVNEQTFAVMQKVDDAVIGPLAHGYERGLPAPVRDGLRNFLHNLREPVVAANYVLQLKPGKAAETLGRFAINTTAGAAGLVDVAPRKPFRLPYRKNSFADTLGYYGVGTGPYLVLPVIGATTLRDLVGNVLDAGALPNLGGTLLSSPYYSAGSYTAHALDKRVEEDETLQAIHDSGNPYLTMRETYLCKRRAEIDGLHGRPMQDCTPAGAGPAAMDEPANDPSS